MKILSAALLASSLVDRYPGIASEAGLVPSIDAQGGEVDDIAAQAAVRGFSATSGPLSWVKATDNFYEAGELVQKGDYVQVKDGVAKWLEAQDRAVIVEESEVESAQISKTKGVVKG